MSRQKIPRWPAVDSVNGTRSLCGDDETGWLVNAITGSPVWEHGRNALFVVQGLAVSFFDGCRHFRHGHVVLDGNLDEVDVIDAVFHWLPRSVGAVYLKKFLPQDRLGKRRIEILNVPVLTLLRELTAGR